MRSFTQLFIIQAKMFSRDIVSVLITLLLPVLLAVFISFIFSKSTSTIKIGIVDHSGESIGQSITEKLLAISQVKVKVSNEESENKSIENLKAEKSDISVIIPKGLFSERGEIKVYYDSNRFTSAGTGLQLITNLLSEFNKKLNNKEIKDYFVQKNISIVPETRTLADFYMPNFLAISIFWLSLFATALPLVKMRESKILLRMGATPLPKSSFVISAILLRLIIGIMQGILFIVIGKLLLDIKLHNYLFLVIIIVGNLVFITLGFMIAAITKSLEKTELIVQLVNFIMMFLSGVFFTRDILPDIVNKIAYTLPLHYLADSLRQTISGYPGVFSIGVDCGVLVVFGLVFTSITFKLWRWS